MFKNQHWYFEQWSKLVRNLGLVIVCRNSAGSPAFLILGFSLFFNTSVQMVKYYLKIGHAQDFRSTSLLNSSLIVILSSDANDNADNLNKPTNNIFEGRKFTKVCYLFRFYVS